MKIVTGYKVHTFNNKETDNLIKMWAKDLNSQLTKENTDGSLRG